MHEQQGLPSRRSRREPLRVRQRRIRALLAIVSIAAIAVGAWLLIPRGLDAASEGAPTGAPSGAPSTAIATPDATEAPAATESPAAPAGVGFRDAAPTAPAASRDEPARVRVASVGLDLGVVPVGVREDGQMDVPELVSELGWYRYGPEPGAADGSAVLAAHVDSDIGAAPMAAVLQASAGDVVEVEMRSGELQRFEITSIEQLSKDDLPLESLFARSGEHVVRLITCGGEWDAAAGAYEDNIVVTATPVRS
ncbi:sortase [Agrococcus sp. 1P02AA]|uniref:class F sortase n=1 Tax=Agrococcus sp. 1P02AA TaxID=3132259 RepID=UPI0039A528DE